MYTDTCDIHGKTHIYRCVWTAISEDLGEVWIKQGPFVTHPKASSAGYKLTPLLPILPYQHPTFDRSSNSRSLAMAARHTSGGMWGLGPEITKQLKIDFGNGDVAFPNPLTCNPSHICLYCLFVFFTARVRFCRLGRMRIGGWAPHRWPYLSHTACLVKVGNEPSVCMCWDALPWTPTGLNSHRWNYHLSELYTEGEASTRSSDNTVWACLCRDISTKAKV